MILNTFPERFNYKHICKAIILLLTALIFLFCSPAAVFAETYDFGTVSIDPGDNWIILTDDNYQEHDEALQSLYKEFLDSYGGSLKALGVSDDYEVFWGFSYDTSLSPDLSSLDDEEIRNAVEKQDGRTTAGGSVLHISDLDIYEGNGFKYVATTETMSSDTFSRPDFRCMTIVDKKTYTLIAYTDSGEDFSDAQKESLVSIFGSIDFKKDTAGATAEETPASDSDDTSIADNLPEGTDSYILKRGLYGAITAMILGIPGLLIGRRRRRGGSAKTSGNGGSAAQGGAETSQADVPVVEEYRPEAPVVEELKPAPQPDRAPSVHAANYNTAASPMQPDLMPYDFDPEENEYTVEDTDEGTFFLSFDDEKTMILEGDADDEKTMVLDEFEPQRPVISFVRNSDNRKIEFSGPIFTVGSSEERSDYAVTDSKTVSRNHATIYMEGNRFYIMDTSSNGTFVNGERIENHGSAAIEDGDTVTLADESFTVHIETPGAIR